MPVYSKYQNKKGRTMYHVISIFVAVVAVAMFASPIVSAMVETFERINAALIF